MSSRSHDALVARLTEYARKHPRGYRARVAGLALLGYAYLFAALTLLAGLVAVLVFFILKNFGAYIILKAVVPFVVLIWLIGKSLWVRFTPPEGMEVRRADAPRLMEEIERVRTAMQAPRVHHVLITDDFNASVAQYPRLGVFGWYHVYLMIGVSLLGALPPEEFRAVLAHEFGHVSRAHGRFGAWIQRVQRTWLQLLGELDHSNHPAQDLFSRFFRWYAPYFEAYTSVLKRTQEFEADEMANRVSPGALGPALCRIEVASRFLDRVFWPEVDTGTRTSAQPPADVHHRLLAAVRGAGAHASVADWLAEEMRQPTRTWDSHPATAERLAALGDAADPPAPFETSAAEALLGPRLAAVADEWSGRWARHVEEYWAEQHQGAVEIMEKLAALEARAEPLTDAERGERIWMTAELHGQHVAIPMARAFLDEGQEAASVHFLLGRALAAENDDAALAHLERAMALDEDYVFGACGTAAALLQRLARDDEAAAYQARWEGRARTLDAAQYERSVQALSRGDRFIPHGLDAEQLAALREQVVVPEVKRAYVVRKRMEHRPEDPCYVIGVVPRGGLKASAASARLAQMLVDRVTLPGTFFVVPLDTGNRAFERAFRDVHAAEIYRAPSLLERATGRA